MFLFARSIENNYNVSVVYKAVKKEGFTLVEMLVAISIMGLLSSVVLASIYSTRAMARDAERVQALEQIKNALELYYHDNGVYPPGNYGYTIDSLSVEVDASYYFPASSNFTPYWDFLASHLVPKYISRLPLDPLNNMASSCYIPWDTFSFICAGINKGNGYTYIVSLDGQKYDLITLLEANESLMCKNKKWPTNALTYDISGTWCRAGATLKVNNLYQANH